MAFDPVCNMEVDPQGAEWTSEYKGTTYYFCDQGCKRAFEKAPDMWLSPSRQMQSGGCSCCGGH
jgi:Cu+-exporting ATPase